MENIAKLLGVFLGLVPVFFLSLLLSWPFQLLWNWLMPVIFGLTKISFWQSYGLLLMAVCLFKNTSSKK
jgi:hypothetical protein